MKTKMWLVLVVFLALLLRLPGVFWGYSVRTRYHPDERTLIRIATNFIEQKIDLGIGYPLFYGNQIGLVARILNPFFGNSLFSLTRRGYDVTFFEWDEFNLVLIGRLISLVYSLATIVLVFFLTGELFKSEKVALISSLFLALCELHIMNSHFATVDVCTTFWIYLSIFFSALLFRTKKPIFLFLASFSSGLVMASKVFFFSVIPIIIWVFLQKKDRLFFFVSVFSIVIAAFVVANEFNFTMVNVFKVRELLGSGALNIGIDKSKWANIPLYFLIIIPSLGFPIFFFLFFGIKKSKFDFRKLVLLSPILIHLLFVFNIDLTSPRHLVPEMPFFCMLAALGFSNIKKFKGSILILILVYSVFFVLSNEYYYVFDTRESMASWIEENLPLGTVFLYDVYAGPAIPKGYFHVGELSEFFDYVLVHEYWMFRFRRSEFSPFSLPSCENIYHSTKDYCVLYQQLAQDPQRILMEFKVKHYFPETYLYKLLMGTNFLLCNGDISIYNLNWTSYSV